MNKIICPTCRNCRIKPIHIRFAIRQYFMQAISPDSRFIVLNLLFNLPYLIYNVEKEKKLSSLFITAVTKLGNYVSVLVLIDTSIRLLGFRLAIRIIRLGFTILSFAICVGDLFSLFTYKTPITASQIVIFFTSNMNESFVFLRIFFLRNVTLLKLVTSFLLMWPVNFLLNRLVCSRKRAAFIYLLSIFISLHSKNILSESNSLFRFQKLLSVARSDIKQLINYQQEINKRPVRITLNNATIPLFIIILGESIARRRLSVYGHSIHTTPHLERRLATGRIVLFDDVISPYCCTNLALQKLFTFSSYELPGQWYEHINVIDILNRAGYWTVWLSNQESVSFWAQQSSVYASRCRDHFYTTYHKDIHSEDTKYDSALIQPFESFISNKRSKSVIFVHTMGCHVAYSARYPKDMRNFTHEVENGRNKGENIILADYDNCILYHDFVIEELLNRIDQENALILYLSDHGEELFEIPSRGYYGHADGYGSPPQVEVPFFFYYTSRFASTYPELPQRMKNCSRRPFMTDDLSHLLLDLLSIRVPEYDETRSLLSSKFNIFRKRVYDHDKTYEKVLHPESS